MELCFMSSIPYSIKEIIAFCKTNEIYIVPRRDHKNIDFLRSVGIDEEDAIEFIRKSLKEEHCIKECVNDRDFPNNYLYIFKILFMNCMCYIKLSISDYHNVVKVISFHKDEGGLL